MLTIINNETNTLYNLALEEYVLKHLNIDEDILLIWQNRESVVIGRDQNPFRDINYPFTHHNKLPIYRRQTSGETVYHDKGVINYSFIVKNLVENRNNQRLFMEPIIDILKELGIDCELKETGDLFLDGKRVSLNTQKLYKNKMVHHGVLFYNTDLEKLDQVLDAPVPNQFEFDKVITNHKNIRNLEEFLEEKLSVKEFKNILLNKLVGDDLLNHKYELDYIDKTKIHKILKEKYDTWEWTYGESPDFIIKKEYDNRMMITLIIKQGIIDRVSIDSYENVMDLLKCLEGTIFNEESLRERLEECKTVDADKLIDTLLYQ